jgi:periplasmic protein CpxP/Spy
MILKAMPRHLRAVALGLAVSAAGGLGLVALAASANEPPPPHGMPGRGPMMLPGLPFAGPMADRLFDEIGATSQQREQLRQITDAAAADLKAQRESGRDEREQMMQVFTQPVVDAKAAEVLRKQMVARHDAASKRITQAMLDSAQVLTADQRVKMADLLKQQAGRMPPPPHAALDGGTGPVHH